MTNSLVRSVRIFVTVGAQMPFDRLVGSVDAWAADRQGCELFAQVGPGGATPANFPACEFLEPSAFRSKVEWCDVMVAHAGMGSILTALQYGKRILVLPRRGDLRETRNDHQVASARRFGELESIDVALTTDELPARLEALGVMQDQTKIQDHASSRLLNAISAIIANA
jgi:UDP-N-acetylglucosamine transferase subunit ALG13